MMTYFQESEEKLSLMKIYSVANSEGEQFEKWYQFSSLYEIF
jgi:hypothetical protein